MSEGIHAPGFEHFITFTEDLDQYAKTSDSIMDVPLLHLVKNAFGYRTLTLSHYQEERFCGIQAIGKLTPSADHYMRNFQRQDPFAAHIGEVCSTNPQVNTLQSSEAFQTDYFGNAYYQFLRTYGVWWALTMPIGTYRLTVYKHEGEADFSPAEREALNLLSRLLRSRHDAQQRIRAQKASGEVQAQLLDSVGIGLVSANHRMAVVDCNQVAAEYLKRLGHSNSIQYCFDQLCNLLRQTGARKPGVHPLVTLEHLGHSVAMEIIPDRGDEDRLYSITILPQEPAGNSPLLPGRLVGQLGLTERELEIARMLVEGKSYQETAEALFVSINTVRTHVRNIYKKNGINNQRMLGQLLR